MYWKKDTIILKVLCIATSMREYLGLIENNKTEVANKLVDNLITDFTTEKYD